MSICRLFCCLCPLFACPADKRILDVCNVDIFHGRSLHRAVMGVICAMSSMVMRIA